jgi:glycerol-3-phosphate dehydrogenase
VLPHHAGLRPRWLIRLGLFLYDHLGGRKILPGTRSVNFSKDVTGQPLKVEFQAGYEYSDCWVEDSRLVTLYAVDAKEHGASINTRTRVTSARRNSGRWEIEVVSESGSTDTVTAKVLINAAGPWVSQVLASVVRQNEPAKIRMVKGSHIVVDRVYDHDRCYIFQNADGRIDFAIPYEGQFTLIGTTDEDYKGEPGKPEISEAETDYLLSSVNEYFKRKITRDMIRWSYSGVRPLYDDGASSAQEATRDYVLKIEGEAGEAQLLSVFGGKITTSRKLAEAVLAKLQPFLPQAKAPWTASAKLPGGMDYFGVEDYVTAQQKKYSFLKPAQIQRLFRAYGTRMELILGDARFASDLGVSFGPLSAKEVDYLRHEEFVQSTDDILWRRSKLGLHMSSEQVVALRDYMGETDLKKRVKTTA